MRASPEDQLRLLDLQVLDSTHDRLVTRRRSLPALAEIDHAEAEVARLEDLALAARTEAADEARAQVRLENEVEQVRARSARDRTRLDTGAVSSARELESLQSEIASLARRQASLEDDLLEVMQRREDAEARAEQLLAEQAAAARRREEAVVDRDRSWADIDAELAEVARRRAELAALLPSDLLALYERVRADRGGVGAAALVRHRCEGCHLELGGAELAAARNAAPEEVLRCEECQRILVRTAESGLG